MSQVAKEVSPCENGIDTGTLTPTSLLDGVREFVADAQRQKQPFHDGDAGMERTLGLTDLLFLGVGGTLGSGLFLLAGRAAREVAGPAVSLSFIAAAIACVFSGLSYAEMSSRLPMCGGAYAFVYATVGEFAAFIIGMCLTLEYGVSSAAVARSWAAYIGEVALWLPPWVVGRDSTWCVLGLVLMVAISMLIAAGTNEVRWVVNSCTIMYGLVVGVIVIVGTPRVDVGNWEPFMPYGYKSVITGASAVFFSYIGFDEVAIVAEEAQNPSSTVPTAILGSLFIVAVLYVAATLVLTGMVKYSNIDLDAPFPVAFRSAGMPLLARAISVGVAIGMANTALVGMLAQTRLFFALSQDGLTPRLLGANARRSTLVCGLVVSLLALRAPTQSLADVVSGGTLMAFLFTNVALILSRYKVLPQGSRRSHRHVYVFVAGSILFGWAMRVHSLISLKIVLYAMSLPLMTAAALLINAENLDAGTEGEIARPSFRCRWVPLVPLLGVVTTSILFTQLSPKALLALACWLSMSSVLYCMHGRFHSFANDLGPIPSERSPVTSHPF